MRYAVLQFNTKDDRSKNLRVADELVRRAAGQGADVVCLPEMWAFIGRDEDKVGELKSLMAHP